MSTLSKRWWAPQGERSVSDLLKPGSDPKLDLGLALLGLHRAGAEACELVAQTPVADETVLIAALAESRQLCAPQAIGQVAKSVGGPGYAGLLLRDVLDDAESAALSLYRTCLAKNVSPPAAAHRVGMVYGVPSRALGRYATLAADPKTHETALVDAADRVLFDHVAKVVAEEAQETKELVSKAPTADDPATQYYDARNERGRFARTAQRVEAFPGLSVEELIEAGRKRVAEQDAATVGPEVAKPQRAVRMRDLKQAKPQRTRDLRPQRSPLAQQKLSTKTLSQRELATQTLDSKRLTAQALRVSRMADAPKEAPLVGPVARSVPDMMRTTEDPNEYGFIGQVAFVMSDTEFSVVTRRSGEGTAMSRVVRAGPLAEFVGQPGYRHTEWGGEAAEHRQRLEEVRQEWKAKSENVDAEIIAEYVDMDRLTAMNAEAEKEERTRIKREFLRSYAEDYGVTNLNVNAEITYVQLMPDFEDPEQLVLVYRPPGDNEFRERSIPTAVEVTTSNLTYGIDRAVGTKNSDVQVDPNQAFVYEPSRPGEAKQYWDSSLKMVRREVNMHPADDEDVRRATGKNFGKAAQQDDPKTAYYDARTTDGRFALAEDVSALIARGRAKVEQEDQVEPVVRTRDLRPQRRQKVQRQDKPLEAKPLTARTLTGQSMAERALQTAKLRGQIALSEQAQPRRGEYDPSVLNLPDDFDYTVISSRAMDLVWNRSGQHGFITDTEETWELAPHDRVQLAAQAGANAALPGGDAKVEISTHALDAWNDRLATRRGTHEEVLLHGYVDNVDDLADVAGRLTGHDILRVELVPGRGRMLMTVHVNAEPLPAEHVISYDTRRADPDAITALVPRNAKRLHNAASIEAMLYGLWANAERGRPTVDFLVNPEVKQWIAVSDSRNGG